MARTRRPAEENEARGNPGKRRNPVAKVEVLPVAAFSAPPYLAPKARQVWDEIAPGLIALKLLRQTDCAVFGVLCELLAEAREAKAVLEAEGYHYETQSEHSPRMLRIHPMYLVLDRSRRLILTYGAHFGMSPAARLTILTQLSNNPDPRARGGADDERQQAGLFEDGGDAVPDTGPIGLLAN